MFLNTIISDVFIFIYIYGNLNISRLFIYYIVLPEHGDHLEADYILNQ